MCGVAGIFSYHYAAPPVDRDELRTIRDQMAARGPDGKGEWYSGDRRVALGHRRLSIIDLSDRAAQPMVSADGQLVLSFNGEIYNYKRLRRELEARGRIFRTESDTEVLLHLYSEKKEAMLNDLRGMFAFALWDAGKEAMLLARDPYGIKPLYLADDGWTCRFASQVKALLSSPKISRQQDPAGIAGFYVFGSVPEPYTLYQEIRSVPAGSYQWIDAIGAHAPVRYFSIARIWAEGEQTQPIDAADPQECVREAVIDSVRHHTVADVPLGAFLSAGIDSGALVGVMTETWKAPSLDRIPMNQRGPQAITLAFAEFRGTHADEAPLAEKIARHYGVAHRLRVVGEDEFREDLPRILAAMDQPSIDGINTWFVSKAATEEGLKVALSGVGGDELFGGYPSFRDIPRWSRMLWLPSHIPGLGALTEQVQATFAPLFPKLNPKAAGMLRYGGSYPGAYLLRRGLFLPRELQQIIGTELAEEGLRRLRPLRYIAEQIGTRHTVSQSGQQSGIPLAAHSRVATLESSLYLRNQLLRDTDWSSMAHSLEVRTPLVDATLLRRLAGMLSRLGNAKLLLAGCPAKPLPAAVSQRPKSGFTTPISEWQKRLVSHEARKRVPMLARKEGPWARRWACEVGHS